MAIIDLNSDVGESGPTRTFDDAGIIASTSSVNVACGFHAGEPGGIRATCAAAAAAGVVIGAHPGYRDPEGFGRRFLDVTPARLTDEVIYQIGALQALARAAGSTVRYVKPHGALYNAIVHDPVQARAVVDAVLAVDPGLPLLVLPKSAVQRIAEAAGLRTVPEAFADRAYAPDGTLVPRTQPGAVLGNPGAAIEQALGLATEGRIRAIDGSLIRVDARSICLHGDTAGAVALAAAIRSVLLGAGVRIEGFV